MNVLWSALAALLVLAACAPTAAPANEHPTATADLSLPVETPGSGTVTTVPGEPPAPREAYRPSQPDSTPGYAGFLEAYEAARAEQADWLRDPVAIALRLAGYPNSEREAPDQVTLYQTDPERAVVVLLLEGAMDDSVRDIEDRVDLVLEDGLWRVEWAGARWRCQPGRGQQDWGIELCV